MRPLAGTIYIYMDSSCVLWLFVDLWYIVDALLSRAVVDWNNSLIVGRSRISGLADISQTYRGVYPTHDVPPPVTELGTAPAWQTETLFL